MAIDDAELEKLLRTYRELVRKPKLAPQLKIIFDVTIGYLEELQAMRYKYIS